MSASFTIRDNDLERLARTLGSPSRVLRELSEQLSEEAIDLVREGFREQADPYGAAWPSKRRPDGRAILVRTGAMRNSWHRTRAGADGFTIAANQHYADFHQQGTRHMPARKMVPDGGDLPAGWRDRFDEVADETLRRVFR